jgi:hypothetical protein
MRASQRDAATPDTSPDPLVHPATTRIPATVAAAHRARMTTIPFEHIQFPPPDRGAGEAQVPALGASQLGWS